MSKFLRSNILSMSGYVPGEQPQNEDYTKLNTNENPYPPSPRVIEAVMEALEGNTLRKYPDPSGVAFRKSAGKVLGVEPECIIIGNGSDDILTMVTRAFVVENGAMVSLTPSYLLYRTLAEIQGARYRTIPFTADWRLPHPWPAKDSSLTLVANPNSPTGTVVGVDELQALAEELNGPLVIDEAYVDFAQESAIRLHRCEGVIVTRSMSKSYSLAGIRFGFGIAHPDLIGQLMKVKDSYNCDALSLAAATAAIEDQEHLQEVRARIIASRNVLTKSLTALGFDVLPSQANFVWCRRKTPSAKSLYERLKERKILVRYMNYESFGDGLRITVGTESEIDLLLQEMKSLL